MKLTRVVDWMFRDRQTGRIVIGQWPNLWLWAFIAASVAELAVSPGTPTAALDLVGKGALTIWAVDELVRGVNPWRRGLGAAVLVGTILHLVR